MSEQTPIEPIDLTEPLWMQQYGESALWYDRFHRYMLVGSRRSLLGTVRVEEAEKGRLKRSLRVPGSWHKAFAKYRWKERAAAWDEYQRSIDREKWEQRFKELRDAAWEMSQEHLNRHKQMLKVPLFEQTMIRDEGGNPVAVTIKPSRWTYKDIIATSTAIITLGAFAIGDVDAAEQLLETLGYKVYLETNENAGIDEFVTEEV